MDHCINDFYCINLLLVGQLIVFCLIKKKYIYCSNICDKSMVTITGTVSVTFMKEFGL